MSPAVWPWIGLNAFILAMLLLDLLVFHRRAHVVRFREAVASSAFWILLAVVFAAGVWWRMGSRAGLEFTTAYLIEESLSVDNLFVFLLVFRAFGVPPERQHRVLFWGILGALVMRLGFILAGVALLERFHLLVYVFGALLVISGVKMWGQHEHRIDPEKNLVLRVSRRVLPVAEGDRHERFFVRRAGRLLVTPLFLVLVVVEATDLLFALDSIPAVLAVSRDSFIVYSSNAFAVLGLRSLYFALSGFMGLFHRVHHGLSAILVFVGAKMLLAELIEVPTPVSLGVVAGILAISVGASVIWPKNDAVAPERRASR